MTPETHRWLCGCAGKTPLDGVVSPARERLRRRLRDSRVRLAGDLEAGLLPATERVERRVGSGDRRRDGDTEWLLPVVLADPATGSNPGEFAAVAGAAYRDLAGGPATVAKGHSVQVPRAGRPTVWGERLRTVGAPRPGYRAANVDLLHAFPDLDPSSTASIAVRHALNDCYAYGATGGTVRPVVAVPDGAAIDAEAVARWYEGAAPRVRDPALVRHSGDAWLCGATATARVRCRPPVRREAVAPGDAVLVHRPLGGLALYAAAVDAEVPSMRRRALDALTRDHAPVAEVVAAFSPDPGERFDPECHLKLAVDVSGPGVGGVSAALPDGLALRVDRLPLLDPPGIRRARDRWLLPDATVETNGPLAVVGAPPVVDAAAEALRGRSGTDPRRIGAVVASDAPMEWASSVDLERYVERAARIGDRVHV